MEIDYIMDCRRAENVPACTMYPNFQAVATTLRKAKTATLNDWGAFF